MNLDITFCSGKRCEVKDQCGRCWDRLKEWRKTLPEDYYVRAVSLAEWSDPDGQKEPCKMFFKRENENVRSAR